MYEVPEFCTACGGACCRQMPGATFPEDWGTPLDVQGLLEALRGGRWAIDWWEGDPRRDNPEVLLSRACYVRPATVEKIGRLYDASWGGVCNFFTPGIGCQLPPNERPTECRYLEPADLDPVKGYHDCKDHGKDKGQAAIAWIPYEDLLENIE